MRESELFEGNRFVRGIKKIHDRLLAIVRLYDQLRPAHVTLAVAWRQTLLLTLELSRLRKAYLIPLSRFWGPAAIEWPTFTPKQYHPTAKDDRACRSGSDIMRLSPSRDMSTPEWRNQPHCGARLSLTASAHPTRFGNYLAHRRSACQFAW